MAVYFNEFDPKAAAWLRELIKQGHIADGVVDERSIVDVTPDELRGFTQCHFFAGIGVWSYALRSAGWADDRPVWTGSCPCQPFSAAGARGGFDDQRHLWPHWHHLISQCRPSVVFGEQVASKDGLGWLDLVHADMEATGYAFGAADLCAAGVGAPHIRQRLWFVGLADASGERRDGQQICIQPREPRQEGAEAAGSSGHHGLADADNAKRWSDTAGGNVGDGHHAGRQEGAGHAKGRGSDHGLADAEGSRWTGEPIRQSGRGSERGASGHCEPDRLADAADAGLQIGRGGSGGEPGSVEQPERLRADVGLADAGSGGGAQGLPEPQQRQEGFAGEYDHGGDQSAWGQTALGATRPGPTNGFWRDADWLFCRDGKWRPVEPGTFPLADGAAQRVGRLRGYGNAIAAPVAQTFIESVMEILA